MVLTDEIKSFSKEVPFVPISTTSKDGKPHLIVVGKVKEIRDDDILVFGVYKMEKTQQNISDNGLMQVVLADTSEAPKGYRLCGKACIEDKDVLFKVESVEGLL